MGLNGTHVPEHGAREAVLLHVLCFELGDRGRVVRVELAELRVIRVAVPFEWYLSHGCTRPGQVLVRVAHGPTLFGRCHQNPSLRVCVAILTHRIEGLIEAVGVIERACVKRDAESDLVRGGAV